MQRVRRRASRPAARDRARPAARSTRPPTRRSSTCRPAARAAGRRAARPRRAQPAPRRVAVELLLRGRARRAPRLPVAAAPDPAERRPRARRDRRPLRAPAAASRSTSSASGTSTSPSSTTACCATSTPPTTAGWRTMARFREELWSAPLRRGAQPLRGVGSASKERRARFLLERPARGQGTPRSQPARVVRRRRLRVQVRDDGGVRACVAVVRQAAKRLEVVVAITHGDDQALLPYGGELGVRGDAMRPDRFRP